MCLIIYFLALAFADNVFYPDLMAQGLVPVRMHNFQNLDGRIAIEFELREDALDVLVLRRYKRCLTGVCMYLTKALLALTSGPKEKILDNKPGCLIFLNLIVFAER